MKTPSADEAALRAMKHGPAGRMKRSPKGTMKDGMLRILHFKTLPRKV